MSLQEKINKLVTLLKDEPSFMGIDLHNDKLTVFVSSAYFAQEIKEPLSTIDVNVIIGKRWKLSNQH